MKTQPSNIAPPSVGSTIGSYTLVESIGLGGNASVFKATSDTFGTVAIKVLHPGKLSDLDIRRFHREFQAMKVLDHPNIIQVFESGMHGVYPWMSMELVSGGDLTAYIDRWNDQSPNTEKLQEIEKVIGQLCLALQHLHSKRMIHRDLKPSNILLTERGQVKLTDFGGVKAPHSFKTDLTTLGALVGTVAFMAPEQILGEPLDQRTDLYSLGAILYMCLTGSKPFEAKSIAEYLAKHLSEEAPNPTIRSPETPEHLSDLCGRLLQKDPENRPSTATDILAFLRNQGTGSHPFGTRRFIEQALSWIDQNPTGILWLHAHHGMGLKSVFQYIVQHLKNTGVKVVLGYQIPDTKDPIVLVCTSHIEKVPTQFFTTLKKRIAAGQSILCIINTPDKWSVFKQYLQVPTQAYSMPRLSEAQIQQLLYPFGLSKLGMQLIARRLHGLYKGRVEYIQEVLQHPWIHTLRTLSSNDLQRIAIPSSKSCLSQQSRMWNTVSPASKPVLHALLVFAEPISITNLSRIVDISSDQLMGLIEWLEHEQWIERLEFDLNQQVQIHPIRFGGILYRLIPTVEQQHWHQKIASFLQQKSRLRTEDRLRILYHLDQLEPSREANNQRFRLIKVAMKRYKWQDCVDFLEHIHETFLTKKEQLEFHRAACEVYFQLQDATRCERSVHFLLNEPTIPPEEHQRLQHKQFILKHQQCPFDEDDNSLDSVLLQSNPLDVQHRQSLILRGIQHCYQRRFDEASKLWNTVSTPHEGDLSEQQAELGLAFIESLNNPTSTRFLERMNEFLESHTEPWKLWLYECLLVTGRWDDLQEHLSERRAFERSGQLERIFETWMDYLFGNAPRARERMEQFNNLDGAYTKYSDIRQLLHIVRLQKILHLPLVTPLIRWSSLGQTIEFHQQQWSSIQQGIYPLDKLPIFWQYDLLLFDAASKAQSKDEKFRLWSQLSSNAHGIRLQVSKRFSKDNNASEWVEIHQQTLRDCARHMTCDIHIWQ